MFSGANIRKLAKNVYLSLFTFEDFPVELVSGNNMQCPSKCCPPKCNDTTNYILRFMVHCATINNLIHIKFSSVPWCYSSTNDLPVICLVMYKLSSKLSNFQVSTKSIVWPWPRPVCRSIPCRTPPAEESLFVKIVEFISAS